MGTQAVVALVIGVVVVFFVPALVWSTVVSGLYQVVRNKVRAGLKATARKATVKVK
jgi:hypothetical protein